MRFAWDWSMKDGYPAPGAEKHGSRVFSTFACGGGSTMGYKLAGYDVVAANDIDPKMRAVYERNHRPAMFVEGSIRGMAERGVPDELTDLDILDGSPPCSVFSSAGDREAAWGKEKRFKEGQALQTLDDLFFDFIELAAHLRPKVVIAENVKGLLQGNARGYAVEIMERFGDAGYDVQLFLLNAALMGVPQRRERAFFVCRRSDLSLPEIALDFDGEPVRMPEVCAACDEVIGAPMTKAFAEAWNRLGNEYGKFAKRDPKGNFYNCYKIHPEQVMSTIPATDASVKAHWGVPHRLSDEVLARCSTFPRDYDYMGIKPQWLVGMSVPPVMMANVAWEVWRQLLK